MSVQSLPGSSACANATTIRLTGDVGPVGKRAATILARIIAERLTPQGGNTFTKNVPAGDVELRIDPGLLPDAFAIDRLTDNAAVVRGGDGRGLLSGCGRLVRRSRIGRAGIRFCESQPVSVPGKSLRGMYAAIHNYNSYQVAPLPFLERYIEELALWGINAFAVVFHMFHFKGIDDPETREYIERLNALCRIAKAVGMETMLLFVCNDGYINTPEHLRYKGDVARNWGTEICPSDPEGLALIRRQFEELLTAITPIDHVTLWPYDSGGCRCERCHPWGINGYLHLSRELADIFHRRLPGGKLFLSTWYFDYNLGKLGEWENLFSLLDHGELDWVDGILADGAFVNGYFPKEICERHVSKPVISFLEISMLTGGPWGGFGANPVPGFIQKQWDIEKNIVTGGIPYSEGLFEDINKILWAGLCWDPDRPAAEILEEYCGYEFDWHLKRPLAEAVMALEPARGYVDRKLTKDFSRSLEVWEAFSFLDRCLDWRARNSWRWRQVLLRAKIDAECARSGKNPTAAMGRAHDELFRLYQLDDRAFCYIRPLDVVGDGDPSLRRLAFKQTGKSLLDFCARRKTQHEDAGDGKK